MSVKCKRPNLFYSPPAVVVLVYARHAWRHESVDVTSKKSGVEDRHHFDDDHMHMHATRSHVWSLPVVANRAELSLLYCDNDLHCILRLQQGGPWMGARAACHCFTCVCLLTKKINKNLVSMPMSEYNIIGCRKESFRYRSVGRWTGRVISLVHPQCVSPSARARMGIRGRDGGEQEQRAPFSFVVRAHHRFTRVIRTRPAACAANLSTDGDPERRARVPTENGQAGLVRQRKDMLFYIFFVFKCLSHLILTIYFIKKV
jgi:hypothetical protein